MGGAALVSKAMSKHACRQHEAAVVRRSCERFTAMQQPLTAAQVSGAGTCSGSGFQCTCTVPDTVCFPCCPCCCCATLCAQVVAAASSLVKRGARNVLVTLGERGALLVAADGRIVRQQALPVPGGVVVDATAAGESGMISGDALLSADISAVALLPVAAAGSAGRRAASAEQTV
jgi:hypothetical protein